MNVESKAVTLKNNIVTSLKSAVNDAASAMPDLSGKKLVMGFWHNWPSEGSTGYQRGHFREMALTDIPEDYNVVAVAFMKGSGIPTFKPYNVSDEEFRHQIGVLNSQGRAVLISLGGADAHISLSPGQEEAFSCEIIRLVETYGFDGLDIDLEQAAITENANQTVIPSALKLVKDHYRKEGKNFIISMAPEFPYLRTGGHYEAYIKNLDGYYDFIAPQYYNQGGDGVWVDEINAWITQNNDAQKELFLYYLTDSIVNGTRGYFRIPHDKFAIGLPSNIDAAATGYVVDPNATLNALKRLEDEGQGIRGLMTWSINWDDGSDKNGNPYNWEFIKRYGHISSGENPPPADKPSVPGSLTASALTETSAALQWSASSGSNQITHYSVYRDGKVVAPTVNGLTWTDTALFAGTEYQYQVSATDSAGNTSALSAVLKVKTTGGSGGGNGDVEEWQNNKAYSVNDKVTYKGKTYICLQAHTSNPGWTPDAAFTLWRAV